MPVLAVLILLPAALLLTGPAAGETLKETLTIDRLEWARTTSGEDLRWPDAVDYCQQLHVADHRDWRLPSMQELKTLHDPSASSGIRAPFEIDTCCLWSGESLVDRPAPDGDEIAGTPEMYHWGLILDGGLEYYAVHVFTDGQALCVRDHRAPVRKSSNQDAGHRPGSPEGSGGITSSRSSGHS